MKKLFFAVLVILGTGEINALPVGNPAEASLFLCCDECICFKDCLHLSIGFYGDYVFNRHLETVTGRKIDYSQITTNAGYLALKMWDRVTLFTTMGASKFRFNTSLGPFNNTNRSPRFEFESSTAFSWSIGGQGTVWQCSCFYLGIEGQYFSSCPPAKVLFARANVDAYPDESSRRQYREWQIGLGISYRYNTYFVPYVAVKYAKAFWNFDDQFFFLTSSTTALIPNVRNSKNWGYAIGVSFAPCSSERISIRAEGRFGDEKAVHVLGQMHF